MSSDLVLAGIAILVVAMVAVIASTSGGSTPAKNAADTGVPGSSPAPAGSLVALGGATGSAAPAASSAKPLVPAATSTSADAAALQAEIAGNEHAASAVGQHIALTTDGGGGEFGFALDSGRSLMFAFQSAKGPGGWSNFAAVPGSPADLVSEPAAAADQSGDVEVFARDAVDHLVAGWQTANGGWAWSEQIGGALPAAPVGDPAALRRPDGKVEVFVKLDGGAVATATQQGTSDTSGWSNWTSLGGDLGGNPVAYADSDGDTDLFARSASNTLVADFLSGSGSWSGWTTVSSSPADLVADPFALNNHGGLTEVFTTTSAGNLDSTWGNGGAQWTWGAPLTGNSLGSAIIGTPTGISWPADGHLEIYAALANGQLAHAWQNAPDGTTNWSLWGTLPGNPGGYPAAFVNGTGAPEVMMFGPSSEIGFIFWLGTQWSAPIAMPGAI